MRSSLLDRVLGTALVLLLSAWAVSHAVHLVVDVMPQLLMIATLIVASIIGWRLYQAKRTGW